MKKNSLKPFFSPEGIAVIGASSNPTKLGYGLARNLVQSNYQGVVHFVNPHGGSLLGRPMRRTVAEIPDPVDLAILLIPAPAVPKALRECGERGIRACIVSSGGFRETGPQGIDLENELLHIAQEFGIRLLGPNCIGILDTHYPFDATFLPPPGPTPGDVAFISHSGAICAAVVDWARGQGFGLSRLVSLGNQLDVNETDVLGPVSGDPYTNVLCLYLEGVSDGRRFVEEASRVTRRKPVIALKVGRSASGQRAVASHTGALAGLESAYNAAFRQSGVIRADTSEEMFDWARALAWCSPPNGRRMAVLTNAGGPGVTAADALEAHGLLLADLQPGTLSQLRALLPEAASLKNPVDMLAAASPEQYAGSLQALLNDPGVDGAMVILPPPPMYTAGAVAKSIIPVIYQYKKPVVVALMGERLIQEAVEHFRAAHVPEYRFPERAASALGILVQRAEYLETTDYHTVQKNSPDHAQPELVSAILADLSEKDGFLPPEAASRVLAAYGIPVLAATIAHSAEEAAQSADQAGYPVALKVVSEQIPHKSDVGGVLLGLSDAEAVREGYQQIIRDVRQARPEAEIEGVSVQRMVKPGQEVIVGALQDSQFGALVMFGSGGIEVEGLKDVSFSLAPIDRSEAERMLESTWAGRKLHGYRSLEPADREAVLDTLIRFSHLAADFPELAEIEVNPLRVLAKGEGAYALDVRIRRENSV